MSDTNTNPQAVTEPTSLSGRGAVFLDRDGTLTEEVGYVNHIDRVWLFPWTAEAIRRLNQAEIPVIVVTNQSGVGQGYFPEKLVGEAHRKISDELAAQGARVDAFFYCPHHPSARIEAYRMDCRCRKPAPGMVEEAMRRFPIDPRASCVVGDSGRDMQLGFAIGARTVLVRTGYGKGNYEYQRHTWPRLPDLVAENLLEAVEWILDGAARTERTRASEVEGAPGSSNR
jgi:D-glycero-D-manno-heptose 1,7-bisphosphate phosphatase